MLLALALCVTQSTTAVENPFKNCLRIGDAVSPYGDWNKDGRADFLVSAPPKWPGRTEPTVVLVSGKDGLGLLTLHGEVGFGSTLAVLDDVNCDSFPEIVIGGEDDGWRTRVLSGRNGEELYSVAGAGAVAVPDENGDALPDFMLWTLDLDAKSSPTRLTFCSGVDGKPIRSLAVPYGEFIRIPDSDGDGVADFVVARASGISPEPPSAQLDVVSGRDAAVLGRRTFDVQCTFPMLSVVDSGELDLAGRPRIVVSLFHDPYSDWIDGRNAPLPPGSVTVLSTPSLATAFELTATRAHCANGYSLAAGEDIDGDGHGDILVSEYPDLFEDAAPRLRIYSGFDGALIRGQNGCENFGHTVNWVGDIDADGVADYAVASLHRDALSYDPSDHLTVYSGKGGELLGTLMTECCRHFLVEAELHRSK